MKAAINGDILVQSLHTVLWGLLEQIFVFKDAQHYSSMSRPVRSQWNRDENIYRQAYTNIKARFGLLYVGVEFS
jgi:hypothetical protein